MLVLAVGTMIATVGRSMPTGRSTQGIFPAAGHRHHHGGEHRGDAGRIFSFAAMAKLQSQVADIVMADPAVSTIGSFNGATSGSSAVNSGRMFISLKPLKPAENQRGPGHQPACARKMARHRRHHLYSRRRRRTSASADAMARLNINTRSRRPTWMSSTIGPIMLVNKLRAIPATQGREQRPADRRACRPMSSLTVTPQRGWAFHQPSLTTRFMTRSANVRSRSFTSNTASITSCWRWIPSSSCPGVAFQNLRAPHQRHGRHHSAGVGGEVRAQQRLSVGQPPGTVSRRHDHASTSTPGVSLGQATELIQKAKQELRMPSSVQGSSQGTAQVFKASLATHAVAGRSRP